MGGARRVGAALCAAAAAAACARAQGGVGAWTAAEARAAALGANTELVWSHCEPDCYGWLFRASSGLHAGALPGQRCALGLVSRGASGGGASVNETWNATGWWWWDSERGSVLVALTSQGQEWSALATGSPPKACHDVVSLPVSGGGSVALQVCVGFTGSVADHGLSVVDGRTHGLVQLATTFGNGTRDVVVLVDVQSSEWSCKCTDYLGLLVVAIVLVVALVFCVPCACYAWVCPRQRSYSRVTTTDDDLLYAHNALDNPDGGGDPYEPLGKGSAPVPIGGGRASINHSSSGSGIHWLGVSVASSGVSGHGLYVAPAAGQATSGTAGGLVPPARTKLPYTDGAPEPTAPPPVPASFGGPGALALGPPAAPVPAPAPPIPAARPPPGAQQRQGRTEMVSASFAPQGLASRRS